MDIHRCGDCQKEFDLFENFLIHKLFFEQYKLTVESSKRIPGLRLPKFIKTQDQLKSTQEESSTKVIEAMPAGPSVDAAELTSSAEPMAAAPSEEARSPPAEDPSTISQQGDMEESDDNVSVSESLRIDETAGVKENNTSSCLDVQTELRQNNSSQFYCKQCGRCYKNRVVLRVHEETVHSSQRPFTCSVCQQAVKTKGSLVRHVRTHTGERPFHCSECGRAFHDSGTLCRHVKLVHRKKTAAQQSKNMQILIITKVGEVPGPSRLPT